MAGGVNKVILVGNLGQDPESKHVSNSVVCQFTVATNESWNDKDGKKQERVEWHSIVTWGKLAEICDKYLKKGRQVYVEGRLQIRSWEDKKDGSKRYKTEVVASTVQFLGEKEGSKSGGSRNDSSGSNYGPPDSGYDDIPF